MACYHSFSKVCETRKVHLCAGPPVLKVFYFSFILHGRSQGQELGGVFLAEKVGLGIYIRYSRFGLTFYCFRYFLFLLINVVFIFLVASTYWALVRDLANSPAKVPEKLAQALKRGVAKRFFVCYVILQGKCDTFTFGPSYA